MFLKGKNLKIGIQIAKKKKLLNKFNNLKTERIQSDIN